MHSTNFQKLTTPQPLTSLQPPCGHAHSMCTHVRARTHARTHTHTPQLLLCCTALGLKTSWVRNKREVSLIDMETFDLPELSCNKYFC